LGIEDYWWKLTPFDSICQLKSSVKKEYCIVDLLADLKIGKLPIFKTFDNLSLPEKDEKDGGD
jgi:hypothetical protein